MEHTEAPAASAVCLSVESLSAVLQLHRLLGGWAGLTCAQLRALPAPPAVDGAPAPMWASVPVKRGQTLKVGAVHGGASGGSRAYLAFAGKPARRSSSPSFFFLFSFFFGR